jgi:hypothetical protein
MEPEVIRDGSKTPMLSLSQLRKISRKAGFQITKSRRGGMFRLVSINENRIVLGEKFDATERQIFDFLRRHSAGASAAA